MPSSITVNMATDSPVVVTFPSTVVVNNGSGTTGPRPFLTLWCADDSAAHDLLLVLDTETGQYRTYLDPNPSTNVAEVIQLKADDDTVHELVVRQYSSGVYQLLIS